MIITKIQAGLGNQLFQYAAGRALSIYHNTDLKLDLTFYDDLNNKNAYRLNRFKSIAQKAERDEFENLKNVNLIPKPIRLLKKLGIGLHPYYKKSHVIEHEVFSLFIKRTTHSNNYYIEGWLGNEKYFKDYRDTILVDFNADFLLNNDNLRIQDDIKNTNSVAVHIRRGDYLINPYFKTLSVEYYIKAVERAMFEIENPIFYFFSNDVEWTRNNFKYVSNAKFIEKNSTPDSSYSTTGDIEDLMLMRSCKHQIIANSTFSWWGAWLNENPNKRIFFPAFWYNDIKAQKQFEKNNFIPSGWIKVNF